MEIVFVDTVFWLARLEPNDQWKESAEQALQLVPTAKFVTTYEVLIEVLNGMARRGPHLRESSSSYVAGLRNLSSLEIVKQSRSKFDGGLDLYRKRLDKRYSLTDCISMRVMTRLGIQKILTRDHYFEQEGFTILMK